MAATIMSAAPSRTRDDVAIGQIVKPFGVRGEVRVRSLSDVPGRFESLTRATLVPDAGEPVATGVRSVRPHGEAYIVAFDVFATPEEAARFRGALVTIPPDPAPAHPAGSFYHYELIGLAVATEAGEAVGRIADILETPGHAVFVVRDGGREVLVPAARTIIAAVDVPRGIMTIKNVPGLLGEADAL